MKCMKNLKVMRVIDYSVDSVVEDGAVNVESVTVDSSSDTSFGSARMRPGAHTHPKVGVGEELVEVREEAEKEAGKQAEAEGEEEHLDVE